MDDLTLSEREELNALRLRVVELERKLRDYHDVENAREILDLPQIDPNML